MAILTNKHYVEMANSFITNVKLANDSFYVFVSKPDPWLNANGVQDDSSNSVLFNTAVDTLTAEELSVYNGMLYGKVISGSDVQNLIPRYNWTSGTVYARYDQNNPNLFSSQFYVMNSSYQVFKVINNNLGAPSTVMPTITSTVGTFTTSDGYVWKYMYSIDSVSNTKFTTSQYIPVFANTQVVANAVGGTIDSAYIYNSGSGYNVYETGFLQNFIGPYQIQLPNTSSSANNYYTGSSVYLNSGYGAGQLNNIIAYNGASKIITTSNPFQYYTYLGIGYGYSGTFSVGYTVSQPFVNLTTTNLNGLFNLGDSIAQSPTYNSSNGASGYVVSVNNSTIVIGGNTSSFNTTTPIYNVSNNSYVQISTPVFTYANGSTVLALSSGTITAATFVNNYISPTRTGTLNARKVVSANSTALVVDSAFSNVAWGSLSYIINNSFEALSVGYNSVTGTITSINANSVLLTLNAFSAPGSYFLQGETVYAGNSSVINTAISSVVAYSNSSAVILQSGNNWVTNTSIYGQSSQISANITSSSTYYPTITVSSPTVINGQSFVSGANIYFSLNGSATGNAQLYYSTSIPNNLTQYIIAPSVTISGDGANASAYAVVNTSLGSGNGVSQIVFTNPGSGYTNAFITITSNNQYGSGANVIPIIAPIAGHGSDPTTELGGRYVGISKSFGNLASESYKFPYYGTFRTAGILANPGFDDVTVNLTGINRMKITANAGISASVPTGIIGTSNLIFNYSNSTSIVNSVFFGTIVNSNVTVNAANSSLYNYTIELANTSGTINVNTYFQSLGNSPLFLNTPVANVVYFTLGNNTEIVNEIGGASGKVSQLISNTSIKLTNVYGKFTTGNVMYDPVINAYATVSQILMSNGSLDVSSTFGNTFNQMMRYTLSANNLPFQQFEYVSQTGIPSSNAFIVATTTDLDIVCSNASGSFTLGQSLIDGPSSNTSVIIYANNYSTNNYYFKVTNVSNTTGFNVGDTVSNGLGVTAKIANIFPVLVMSNVKGTKFQVSTNIVGSISGATGNCINSSSITYPNLVRNSGSVLYLENFAPVTKTANSSEQINLVIKF